MTGSGDDGGTGVWAAMTGGTSDPGAYNVAMGASGTFMRYGGPGYC